MQLKTITKVDKSKIKDLSFRKGEILSDPADQTIRSYNLDRALRLGNVYKGRVQVQFETVDFKPMETEATIWAVTEKYIMLKGGAVIPIRAIFNVVL